MKSYRIELKYLNDGTLINSRELINVIPNLEDLTLTFARHELYEGLFIDVADTIQLTKEDKDYLISSYEDWISRISNLYTLEIEIFLLDKLTLIYESVYLGVAEWESYNEGDEIAEISFVEKSTSVSLSENDNLEIDLKATNETKNVVYNAAVPLEAHNEIRYIGFYNSKTNIAVQDTYYPLIARSVNLDEDNAKNNFITGHEDTLINILPIDSLGVDITINVDIFGTVVFEYTAPDIDIYTFTFTFKLITESIVDGTIIENIFLTKQLVESLPIASLTLDINDDSSVTFDTSSINAIEGLNSHIEIALNITRQGGLVLPSINEDFYFSKDNSVNRMMAIYSDSVIMNTPISIMSLSNVMSEFNSKVIDIDYSYIDTSMLNDLFFTTLAGINNSDTYIMQSFNSFFQELKKLAFVGLELQNDIVYLKSLNSIYDNTSPAIDLGEAIGLTKQVNTDLLFNSLEIGAVTDTKDINEYEYVQKITYAFKSGISKIKTHLLDKWKPSATYINTALAQVFDGTIKTENKTIIPIFAKKVGAILEEPTPITSSFAFGTGINAEFGLYKILQAWRNYYISILTTDNELTISTTDLNRTIEIQDNEDNIVTELTSLSYDLTTPPFNNIAVNQIFGIEKYTIELPITPEIYKTIKSNPTKRFFVNYKGVDYFFFLRNIEIVLLNNSVATLKAWESNKKT